MSFGGRTPESYLTRSDSKNPATTCKGITSAGRPCRRALAAAKTISPSSSPTRDDDDDNGNGVLAVLDAGDAAAFFCWQHKDQAETLVAQLKNRSGVVPLKHRSSIDTLIERVGILDLDDADEDQVRPVHDRHRPKADHSKQQKYTSRKRNTLPEQWQHIQGPLMSVPEEIVEIEGYSTPQLPRSRTRPERRRIDDRRRSNVKASWSCCVQTDDAEDLPPARRRRRSDKPHVRTSSHLKVASHHSNQLVQQGSPATPVRHKPVSSTIPEMQHNSSSNPSNLFSPTEAAGHATPTRPQLPLRYSSTSPPHSQTATLLSIIPAHLSPSITSALLAELSRPISEADEEGYIYIFWLTPESDLTKPDDEIASSLLDDDASPLPSLVSRSQRQYGKSRLATVHRTNQALQRYASVRRTPTEPQKILLKIGRAGNVHRRLSQWTKQCGQNITLIRYYPYQRGGPSTPSGLIQSSGKVPHVHRVERLIHLELADKRLADKQECEACGRVHREWFEVDATRDGVKQIDEVVRRWVGWAEQHNVSAS